MAIAIFLILCAAAEYFLFYRRSNGMHSREFCRETPASIASIQFVGPTAIAVWSEGSSKGFVANEGDTSPKSHPPRGPVPRDEFCVGTSWPSAEAKENWTWRRRVRVFVMVTTPKSTIAALRLAARWSADLGAQITLVTVEEVPQQFPLEKPPVLPDVLERKLYGLICEAEIKETVLLQICLCRRRREGLRQVLPAGCVVVVGGPKRWWSRRERNLQQLLISLGHEVIFARVTGAISPKGSQTGGLDMTLKNKNTRKGKAEAAPWCEPEAGQQTPIFGEPPTASQIAERAHEIYLERGGAPGHELEDWLQAERELGKDVF
jgi:hypothetical protein